MMMPKSASKLPISKMNMFGMGSKMIQHVMKKKKVDALSEMITKADQLDVKMVACTMSMDIMVVDKDELLPNVELGGVGIYLGDADDGNIEILNKKRRVYKLYIKEFYDQKLSQTSYMVACQQTKESIIIDPKRVLDEYKETADAEGFKITQAAETHIHADFASGLRDTAR